MDYWHWYLYLRLTPYLLIPMSFNRVPLDQLPPNLPVFFAEEVGDGWRKPSFGERVRTHWEYLSFYPRVEWKLTAYMTKDELVHDGRTNYRVPVSARAWWKVALQMPRKLWRHYVKREI